MIFFNGEKYTPQKNEKGWFIPYPFIIISKEYAYDESIDYEGFIIKEITDKRGKKVPIIGLKVHKCVDLKCGGTCHVCGKENPHVFLIKGYKPYNNRLHIEVGVCKNCGVIREVERVHDYMHSFEGNKIVYTCCFCGSKYEREINWENLEFIPNDVPLKTLEKCLGLEGMIEEAKTAKPEELYNIWKEYNSVYSKYVNIKGVAEDDLRNIKGSVYLHIKHKGGEKAILELSDGEIPIWTVDSILPYDSDDNEEYNSPEYYRKDLLGKELPVNVAVEHFFKGTEYDGLTYKDILKIYKDLKQKEEELKAKLETKKKEFLSLKMFKLAGSNSSWTFQGYIFGYWEADVIDICNAITHLQKMIKEQGL